MWILSYNRYILKSRDLLLAHYYIYFYTYLDLKKWKQNYNLHIKQKNVYIMYIIIKITSPTFLS